MGVLERYNEKKKREGSSGQSPAKIGVRERLNWAKNNGGQFDVNQDTINAFIEEASEFLKTADEEYSSLGWGNASDVYSARSSKSSDLGFRSSMIRRWLDTNKSRVDEETYKSLLSTLDTIDSGVSQVTGNFKSAFDNFSKFKTEDEYNKALKEYEDYTAKLDFDLDAGQTELETLKANREEIDRLLAEAKAMVPGEGKTLSPMQSQANLARLEEINARLKELGAIGEGAVANLDASISEKERYLNEARRLQGAHALGAVSDPESEFYDPNFEAFSLAGADTPYTALGKKTMHRGKGAAKAYSIDKYRAAAVALYEHEGNETPYGYDKFSLIDKYRLMEDTEFAVFAYYLEKDQKEGTNLAEQYIDSIEESLNKREATAMFADLEGKWALELLFGVEVGLDQFATGVESLFSDKDYIPATSTQMAGQMVRDDLGDSDFKIFGSTVGQIAYDATTTTANMLPSILASTAVGLVNPGAGAVVGAGLMGASAAGNGYTEMLNLGYTKEQARSYAAMVGASETLLQYALGGIGKLGGKLSGNALTKVLSKIDNAYARVAIKLGGEMASEGLEEGIQTVLEAWFKSEVTGMDFEAPNIDEVLYSSLLGALSAAGIGGVSAIGGEAVSNYKASTKYGGAAQDLINEAREIGSADALHFADKYQARLDAGKTLTGAQLNRLIESNTKGIPESDTKKIASAAEARLTELGETGDVEAIASALAKQASGQKLSLVEKAILQNSRYSQRVANELKRKNVESGQYTSDWVKDIGTDEINADIYNLAEEVAGVDTEESKFTVVNGEIRPVEGTYFPRAVYNPKKKTTSFPMQEALARAKEVGATENTSSQKNATEGELETSDNGKTIYKDQEVAIKGVASVKDGRVSLRLNSGETVSASDVSFGSHDEAMFFEMLARTGASADTANELYAAFNAKDDTPALMYIADLPLAYQYGLMGFEKGLANLQIPDAQKRIAYNRGRIDAMTNANDRSKAPAAVKAPSTKAKKNGIIYEGFEYDAETATDVQKASIEGIEALAKFSPTLEFHVYRSELKNGKRVAYIDGELIEAAPNGYFTAGNKIYLDLNAGADGRGVMLYTVSHEIGHYIRLWNAKGFKALGDFLLKQYGKNGVPVDALIKRQKTKIKNRLKREGKPIPSEAKLFDMAYEEMVCDAMSTMFADSKAYEKLAALKMENPSVFKKLGEAIKKILGKLKSLLGIYSEETPDALEAQFVMKFAPEVYEKLQDLYLKAFVEAEVNYESAERTLGENGIAVNGETESASLFSVRDVLSDEQRKKVSLALATRFGVTQQEAMDWLKAETSMASLILNPKYSQYLDYTPDPTEVAIKQNSDYPQGTVDFSPICAKRREFTSVMNNILRLFPNHVFAATDLAKIRTIMQEEGMTIPCGICYVEDRRQLDTIVAQNFIDSLKLYREGSKTRPDGKPFNANQLKGLSLIDGDSYTPSVYELVSLEGLNILKEKNPNMAEAWVKFNNARGMQAVRLLANEAEYKRQILKYSKKTVQSKNDHGGLRVYSFSDAEMFHLIDIIQVITDSATVGLYLQGYTKVNEYARTVKDTGEKLNRSLIPKGELGYHIEDGNVILDYDTVEGIDINHPDFFDNKDNPDVGNITIGVSDVQIRAAMVSDFVDQIIPFHTGQSDDVLGEKGIATWSNYKDFQTEKDIATGKVSEHQINIYTEVLQVLEKEGKPITKRTFVEKFLQVCKENGLTPRFSQFLNTNEKGEYVYTEGYHKMLVDFKTFAQTEVGEYLPQRAVKPIFDNEYITKILKDYVKSQKVKDAELAESMPKVIERITNEIVKADDTMFSVREEYASEIDEWSKDGMPDGETFVLGTTGDILQGLGAIENDIYLQGDKIKKILADHPEMTLDEIKKIPQILENPILVLKSRNVGRSNNQNTRLVLFGSIKAKNGKPILSVMDLRPIENHIVIDDMQKVSSAYTKTADPVAFIRNSYVLYADKNKATSLLRTIGFQMPIELNKSGFVGSISYKGQNVNIFGEKFSDVFGEGSSDGDETRVTDDSVNRQYSDRDVVDISNAEYVKMYHHFGSTKNYEVAGYLLGNGIMLDFSGKHWGDDYSTSRQVDHRDVQEVLDDRGNNGVNAMIDMISNGNIRLMPEAGGICLAVKPNATQMSVLRGYFNHFKGEVVVDIDKVGGDTIHSWEYTRGTSSSKIIGDIKAYFYEGVVPEKKADGETDIRQFLYSDRDAAEFSDADTKFSIREEAPPKKTVEVYKLMRLKDGKIYPLFIDSTEPLEKGTWYDADSPNLDFLKKMPSGIFLVDTDNGSYTSFADYLAKSGEKKTKFPSKQAIEKAAADGLRWVYIEDTAKGQKRFGGETRKYWNLGINGSGAVSTFSMRPGYHAGSLPSMRQIGKGANKDLRDDSFVWTVGEVPADIDYQAEADSNPDKDIPTHIPVNGYYLKATNADKAKSQADVIGWYVAGSYKINRIIGDKEARRIIDEWNAKHPHAQAQYDYDRESGMDFDADTMQLVPRDDTKFSDRDSDSISTRSLLANALEGAAQNDIERQKLAQYKQKIALIEAEQAKLSEIRLKIRELSFAKGPKDTAQIKSLQFEEKQAANRINTYDRQLLNLQATTALKNVLEREKKLAYDKAKKEGKEAMAAYREKVAKTQRELITRWQDSRKQAVEGRNKTAMRHKIKDIAKELDTLLRKPTSKKHIKEELRKAVAEALLAINMDTVGADERVAKYDALIAKAKDPDIIAELTATRDRIQLQGDNLKEKLDALRMAYERIKDSEDIELSMSYQEVIRNSIEAVSQKVGDTSIRDMTLEQLEMVYELYSMIRKTIRDANKLFKQGKAEGIMQTAEAVNEEVRRVGGERSKRLALFVAMKRIGWKLLKPLVAFRTIGSDTLTELYSHLQEGEGTFYGDVSAAQAFIEEQYEKHGFKKWDMKETKTFTAKSGKSFDLTLEQIMSLYAYSRRDQAHAHIIEGGIVFEDAVTVEKKLGIPIKYEVTTKDAFNLSEETLSEIVGSLTAEQKAFVEEMQAYLSDTMGAKGNEVSMEMLGVKLFKEKFYLPIKSSQYYLNFSTEEAGEIKLKNPAFSKETVQHANNPIVLHNFTDLWAEHVNNMSMYHSFVLALEDFTRVYNYKTKTDANVETMSTKKTIETAYPGATQYISDFLKSLNGGVRMDTVGFAEKLTSLSKKGAVLGSASVAIQQPSAIMRAMAVINPLYFATTAPKSINLLKHKQDWEELKKYAPIAGIKEMGRFDVGMGKDTVDWIKANGNVISKIDDILGLGPAFMDEVTWVSIWNAVKRETIHKHKNLSPKSEEFLKIAGDRFTYVISLTQVYDSVFSRSDIMRNKSWIAKALTAFMAEPTTTLNMLWDAWVQGKRTGSVKGFAKVTSATTGAVVASLVFNAALKSIIMAMRDDDEDESYAEKYVEHFFGDFKDSLNPLTLIPVAKDVVSIFKGYDVERMDMALFSDLKKAIDAFDSDTKTDYEKWSGLIGAISSFFGLPVKNVERDIRGLINTVFGDSESTTAEGLLNAMEAGWTGESKPNGQQLYEAMLNGDKEQVKRIEGRFKDQDAIDSAIRKVIREKYEDGDLSAKEAKSQLAKYANMSEDEAASRVQYWDFKQEYPDYDDLSESAVAKYYSDAKSSGISIEVYYDYITKRAMCEGTDSDGDGKTDSGSLKREILKVINSLPISKSQKDALYFLNGWSASTLHEAPWR